jgi:hypothetical protein
VKVVLLLLGQFPLTGEGGCVDLPYCSFHAHCSSARRSPPTADHNYPLLTRAVLWCDYTPPAFVRGVVMRRAASVTGGLTVVLAYLPDVLVDSPHPDPSTHTPPTRI